LLFLWLPSPHAALDRVAKRVREGGHSIPAEIVVRRYWSGLANLHKFYLPLADIEMIYDNSDKKPVLAAERSRNNPLVIRSREKWAAMLKLKP
jgi:predicted ABC-type ATPase